MRAGVVGIVAGAALVPLGAQAFAQSGDGGLTAALSGSKELDAETGERGAGDPNGYGSAAVTIRGRQVCFGITVAQLDAPAAAHIHRGRANQNGPVVVELAAPKRGSAGAVSGCTRAPRDVVNAIRANPSAYYVNVHTGKFPAGAVRGQLRG